MIQNIPVDLEDTLLLALAGDLGVVVSWVRDYSQKIAVIKYQHEWSLLHAEVG